MARRILVVGAGFAGMWAALAAARALDQARVGQGTVEILVIAPEPSLHIRPRLYERPVEAMKAPLTAAFDLAGVHFRAGSVDRIHTDRQEVEMVDAAGVRSTIAYDRLVLAAGSRAFLPPVPGLREHGLSVDQFDEAVHLEQHLQALSHRPSSTARNTVVIVGGGFTGIETAAEMPARLRAVLGDDAGIQVVLVERNDVVGPDLGPGPRPVIEEALRSQGVTCRFGMSVARIDADGLETSNGERIDASTVIWTAGLRANALTAQVPGERDAFGRLHVDQDLQVVGARNVFATGDTAHAATDDEGHVAMMSCQHAMALGRSAGNNAVSDLLGLAKIAYRQPKYVTCLDLGPWGAVYTEGWSREVKMAGAQAKALKHQINTEWIYPPTGNRRAILDAADPLRVVVA